jgi:predicted metal-dependent peptidase
VTNELFTKIRVDFLFAHPFLSVLALSLPHHTVENGKYPITTNGKSISLDSQKLVEMPDEEVKYLYAHVLLHIALKHPSRQTMRDATLWNKACDIVINLVLSKFKNIGKAPKGEEPIERFAKMIAEEVYERLKSEKDGEGEHKDLEESDHSSAEDDGEDEVLDALLV